WGTVDRFVNSDGQTDFGHDSLLGRGYTGHEHFFEVGLIHMNGRMYDAQLGRFLSPDNFIQDPYNTQNFNRYGYVLNNPLVYIDPTGEMAEGSENKNWLWGLAITTVSFVSNSLNSLKNDVGPAINKWFNKHIKGPVDDFFDWIHGRKKKSPPPAVLAVPDARISVDPLVRSNPDISTINIINGGGGRYTIGSNGYISFLDNNGDVGVDTLINNSGQQISIGDRSILPQLASFNSGVDYGITQNMAEAFNLFKFASSSSDVEWGLQSYKLNNGAQTFVLGTSHSPNSAFNGYHLGLPGGYEIENLIFDLHSHLKTRGGSGYGRKEFPFTGDKGRQYSHKVYLDKLGLPLPLYYIYHSPSGGLYRYTPKKGNQFIKKIIKPSDFYTGKF
ncbi:MAG: RHS repeat-associated core domain-containing protein, partial [Bacteroidota bacterium]